MRYVLLAALLYGCGGGGSSVGNGAANNPPIVVPPQPAATFPDYFPYLSGKSGQATAIWRFTGQVLTTYSFVPNLVKWGDSWEHWGLTTCNGEAWVTILGYSHLTDPMWAVTNTRTTWDGVPIVCEQGAPYAPVNLVPGVHVLKQWGRIADQRDYFWAAEYTFGQSELNPCWTGADPYRPVIIQREVWMDRGTPAVRGTVVGDPWVIEPTIIWDYRTAIGLGVGTLWHTTSKDGEWCLSDFHSQ